MNNRKYDHQQICALYSSGLSSTDVARQLGINRDSVKWILRKYHLSRPPAGYNAETRVRDWLLLNGHRVTRQPWTSLYDLLVDGSRVDVKTSNSSIHKIGVYRYPFYQFVIYSQDRKTVKHITHEIDEFYLVLLDEHPSPVFTVASRELIGIQRLEFSKGKKLPIKHRLLGYL